MFDIFKGTSLEGDVVWLEAVTSLETARQRMEEIAAKSPGPHFVFNQATHSIVARTDTRRSVALSPEEQSESA